MRTLQWLCISLFFSLLGASCTKCGSSTIHGAGATFPYPLYTKWFSLYNKANPEVEINYQSIGSGGGIRLLLEKQVDFAASDVPMTDKQLAKAKEPLLHIPMALGAVVLSYNIPGIKDLKLSSEVLADIFLGKITSWDHPEILKENEGLKIPKLPIIVAHRSDASGTTAIFTNFLSQRSKSWAKKVGKGTAVKWPVGLGGKGNEGVAGLIKQSPGSIGYIEQIYAEHNKLPIAAVQNKAGSYLRPTSESITAAMEGVPVPEDFRTSITDPDGKNAYPICGLTYILIYNSMPSEKAIKFIQFLKWALEDGQQYISPLKYAPVPSSFLEKIKQRIESISSQTTETSKSLSNL